MRLLALPDIRVLPYHESVRASIGVLMTIGQRKERINKNTTGHPFCVMFRYFSGKVINY
jgi:hypothetical protein